MENNNYCTACNETLVLHADGSVMCGCDGIDSEQTAIPSTWELTDSELREARLAEQEA